MNQPKYDLSGMDMDEISFVSAGDNPPAKLVMMKREPVAKCEEDHSGLKSGDKCESCGYVMKVAKANPTGRDLYVDQPMEPHKRRKRRRVMEAAMNVQKSPHDGDGDGFYSPGRGMPDKTPMPGRGRPLQRKRGDEGMDDGADTVGVGRLRRASDARRMAPITRVAARRARTGQQRALAREREWGGAQGSDRYQNNISFMYEGEEVFGVITGSTVEDWNVELLSGERITIPKTHKIRRGTHN